MFYGGEKRMRLISALFAQEIALEEQCKMLFQVLASPDLLSSNLARNLLHDSKINCK